MNANCLCRCKNGGRGGSNCCIAIAQADESPVKAYAALMRIAKNFAAAKHHEFENYLSAANRWAKRLPLAEECRISPRLVALKLTSSTHMDGLVFEAALLMATVRRLAKAWGKSQKAAVSNF